jgi:hypothetical protein
MNIVYTFIGSLPTYTFDTVYQTRLFYKGPIYLITNDMNNNLIPILQTKYDVLIVPYEDVYDHDFNKVVSLTSNKFMVINDLKGREKLFIYSFERFFCLYNLMVKYNLDNCFFIEIDNLLYDNPEHWLSGFQQKEIAFMFDNYDRCASGVFYVNHSTSLKILTDYFKEFILNETIFMSEMIALYRFWKKYPELVQLLPVHWNTAMYPEYVYQSIHLYKNTIFDAASMGIYIGGMDPYHTNGTIVRNSKSTWSLIDYTGYTFEWRTDEHGRKIPYISDGTVWYKINNLHIASKELKPHTSILAEY